MIMRKTTRLIERFFQAAEESDEMFLKALQELSRSAESHTSHEARFEGFYRKGIAQARTIRETIAQYGDSVSLDNAPFTVGEAVHQMLKINSWTVSQAAKKLGVSDEVVKSLLEEMMPLSSATVPDIAQFFSAEYGITNSQILREWLITGLRFLEIESSQLAQDISCKAGLRHVPQSGIMSSYRHAARRKMK